MLDFPYKWHIRHTQRQRKPQQTYIPWRCRAGPLKCTDSHSMNAASECKNSSPAHSNLKHKEGNAVSHIMKRLEARHLRVGELFTITL